MSAELSVTLDAKSLSQFRTLLRASRTEAAKSLTFVAEKAQDAWRLENHRVFKLRSNWIDVGVRKQAATSGNLIARVGTIDKFAGRHVIGVDQEKGHNNPHGIFVAPYAQIENAKTHSKIRAALRSMMRTKTKPFWRHGMLLRRIGKGHDAPLTVLGSFREQIRIKPRFDAEGVVGGVVQREFPRIYERLILRWAEQAKP
ncbi:MAG TPA: hypothetical protein VM620_09765 [Hyphomicrobium sp.]|nr:hypothetical protein [Hyphomicrobium sp.]